MRRLLRLSVLLTLAIASPSLARASVTLYVNGASTGSVHDGHSWEAAFLTIDDALEQAGRETYVLVATGNYRIHTPLPAGVSLMGGYRVSPTGGYINRAGPQATILDREYPGSATIAISDGAGADTLVNGFTIHAGDRPAISFRAASPTITNNIVTTRKVVSLSPEPRPVTLLTCNNGSSPLIMGNVFAGAGGHALDMGDGNPIILNNTIVCNENGGIVLYRYSRAWIANNILAGNGVGVWSNHPELTVLRNNCFDDNAVGNYQGPTGAVPVTNATAADLPIYGNIVASPRFAAAEIGDYHIQPDSPCVDAGSDADAMRRRDIDMQDVTQHNTDIGADETDGRPWDIRPPVVRVSTAGDDENDGSTWAKAKRSIPAAVEALMASGGEIWVAEGEYVDDTQSPRAGAVVVPSYISLYGGFGGDEATRDGRIIQAHPTVIGNRQVSYGAVVSTAARGTSRLDGLIIKPLQDPDTTTGIAVTCLTGSPLITNCTLTADGKPGILLRTRYGSPTVTHSLLADCVSKYTPIEISGSSAVFTHVTIRKVTSTNADVFHGTVLNAQTCDALVMRNCLIANNTSAEGRPLFLPTRWGNRLLNNTFVSNRGNVHYRPQHPDSLVANNIFAFNTPADAGGVSDAPGTVNNCYWPAGTLPILDDNGNIAADPLFVDAEHGDYRLSENSPCLDAGDAAVVLPGEMDLDGRPRVQGTGVDMGAYESAHAAAFPTVPDVAKALQAAAGLRAVTPNDMARLNADTGTEGVTLSDALTLLRAFHDHLTTP